MKKTNNKCIFENETLSLTECLDGFWLYDYILGQNISMRAKDEQTAFVEALSFYQKRTQKREEELKELNNKVYSMLALFIEDKEN